MKNKYFLAIMAAIVAIVAYCIIAVVFNVMTIDELPLNFIGATLGSLIGALITLVLLRGQTDIEEKKGKDIRILEKKTEVFQDFIKDVWAIWTDQKITIEEFQDLTSKYYQNLMIYLKKDKLEKIGNCLSEMGKCIDQPKEIDRLRAQIVGIINELSKELELGGEVNTQIMDEHDKIVFPLLFKNMILESLNRQLPVGTILEKGQYEIFREGRYNLEHICFNFKKYNGCKIVIGAFIGQQIWFFLAIDKKYQIEQKLRQNGIYSQRVGTQVDLLNPLHDKDTGEKDLEKAPPLNFSNNESMEKYRRDRRDFSNTLASRANYWFSTIAIEDLSITDFLEKHCGQ